MGGSSLEEDKVLISISRPRLDDPTRRKVEEISGTNLDSCYQCGKCSAGCPSAFVMDLLPHRIIRDLQIGLVDEALASQTPWVCASCEACSVRCPRGIEVARVMEALRQIALRARQDRLEPENLPDETLRKAPPIALIASFRKTTS
jgi:heterodisulfide reductase subunit C